MKNSLFNRTDIQISFAAVFVYSSAFSQSTKRILLLIRQACETAGTEPYVPRPQRGPSVKAGLFRNDEFQYDAVGDSLVCPAGRLNGGKSS